MKHNRHPSPAALWNQKNFPSNLDRMRGSRLRWPGRAPMLHQLPSVAAHFLRRRQNLVFLPLLTMATMGLLWVLSRRE